MKPLRIALLVAASTLLAGCLEVEQHPPWRDGQYNGKDDNLPQQRLYHGDRMAWMSTIENRNWLQDEYGRNRLAEGKLPMCAEMCATKALLGGEANLIGEIYRHRVETRGYGPELWGWDLAYEPGPHGKIELTGNGPRPNQNLQDSQNNPRKLPS